MEADYDIFEIVTVIRDFWLIDPESYQRNYSTKHGQTLAVGHYVVNWPEHIRIRRFDEHASFHGPFKTRKEAQMALDWMVTVKEDNVPPLLEVAALAHSKPSLSLVRKAA
jgi:hypothetical protein